MFRNHTTGVHFSCQIKRSECKSMKNIGFQGSGLDSAHVLRAIHGFVNWAVHQNTFILSPLTTTVFASLAPFITQNRMRQRLSPYYYRID